MAHRGTYGESGSSPSRRLGIPPQPILPGRLEDMRRVLLGGVSSLLVVVATTAVSAQPVSLADVAKREKARRASIAEKSRVYTNDDLRGGPRLTISTPPATTPSADSSDLTTVRPSVDADVPDTPDGQNVEQGEDYWRNRIMTARDARQRADLMAAALQNRVDGLWADFTARDDPFQRAEIEQDRIEALQELERTQADMVRLDEEIDDIQEEARRAGVPPGWLR